MAKSTGPILVAGGLNWANQTIFLDSKSSVMENTVRIGVATGLLAMGFFGLEKVSPNLATGLAYTLLVTSMIVRLPDKTGKKQPTPVERLVSII